MMGGEVLDYESRLKKMGFTTLATRRLRADMLEIMNSMEGIAEDKFSGGMREEGEGIDLHATKKGASRDCQVCFCKQGVCHVE